MPAPAHEFGDPCLPTRVTAAPSGAAWLHEIKHDGYRLMVRRTPQGTRIKTRRGFDWSERYPLIAAAAARLPATSFVLDGEGVILGQDGNSDFDRLHSRRHDGQVQLLGFDLLELDGAHLRREPLESRKATLASLLRRSHDGIQCTSRRLTAAPRSSTPAGSGSKASCRSAAMRHTGMAAAGRG